MFNHDIVVLVDIGKCVGLNNRFYLRSGYPSPPKWAPVSSPVFAWVCIRSTRSLKRPGSAHASASLRGPSAGKHTQNTHTITLARRHTHAYSQRYFRLLNLLIQTKKRFSTLFVYIWFVINRVHFELAIRTWRESLRYYRQAKYSIGSQFRYWNDNCIYIYIKKKRNPWSLQF